MDQEPVKAVEPESAAPGEMKVTPDLPLEYVGKKANVWTHHDRERAFQGVIKEMTAVGLKMKGVNGDEYYISWTAGPVIHPLEY